MPQAAQYLIILSVHVCQVVESIIQAMRCSTLLQKYYKLTIIPPVAIEKDE